MNTSPELDRFAARLRELIRVCDSSGPEAVPDGQLGDRAFDEMALDLFALQFELNAPYRKLCEARHVSPGTIAEWDQIPAVPTSAFKEREVTCLPVAERSIVLHSSGTTQQRPSRHFHSPTSLTIYQESAKRWFYENVLHGSERVCMVFLTPDKVSAPHSSLVHMFEIVSHEFGCADSTFTGAIADDGTWSVDLEKTLRHLRSAEHEGKSVLLAGTAFCFVHLLDGMSGRNLYLRLAPGSRVMETGGYKGRSRAMPKAELHSLLTQRLGVPPAGIVCEYGMSELSSQAYGGAGVACRVESDGSFQFPPWARAQIVSPETGLEVGEGESGLLRVIDLANVYSVLAVQTEDLAIRRGKGFELLGRATLTESRGCSLMSA